MAYLPVVQRSTPWFPSRVEYRKAATFDGYGKPTSYDTAMLRSKTRQAMIEVLEANSLRAKRQGLFCEVSPQEFFAMNDHLVFRGIEYTIVGIDPKQDLRGDDSWVVLTAVVKRGTV